MKCLLCSFTDSNVLKIEEHMNKQHFETECLSALEEINAAVSYKCPLCSKKFMAANTLETHVNHSHENIFSSPKKNNNFESDEYLEKCPMCPSLNFNSAEELIQHFELHFSNNNVSEDRLIAEKLFKEEHKKLKLEQEEFAHLQVLYGMDSKSDFTEQSARNMQKAVNSGKLTISDYYDKQIDFKIAENCGIDDGSSCLKDVIPLIRRKCETSMNVRQTYLCSDLDFYSFSYGDRGWGCGYRNAQMLLSSLFREKKFNKLLFNQLCSKFNITKQSGNVVMPSVSKIQQIIEKAWNQGFDERGCTQLGGKVFKTRKWIGATEVVTLLSFLKIRCQCVDIRQPSANGLHSKMFDWILKYFQKPSNFKPPLYLQHQGHSRTVVGIEVLKDGEIFLLILDPGINRENMEKSLSPYNSSSSLKFIRQSINNFKFKQYQIATVVGIVDSETEYQANKVVENFLTIL